MNKALLLCISAVLFSVSGIFSQITVGYNNPSAAGCINDPTIGTLQWTTPSAVVSSNDIRSYTTAGQQGITNYLKVTGFNFTLPAPCPSCNLNGVSARIESRSPFQPDVAILNNWQALTKSGAGYNFTVTAANPPTIMNRALIVVIGLENGPGTPPIIPPAPGNDSRDVTSVTYGGVPMIQACEVAFSNAASGTTFWARNEIWFLNDSGISSASGNQIIITNPGNDYEYVERVSAVSFQNVDQLAPIFDFRTDTVVGNINPFALGNPAPMVQGSCAVTSVVCGQPGTYVFNNGGASGLAGVTFIEGTDQNGTSIPGYGGSSMTMMTGHAIVPDGTSGSVAPTYQFSGTPNRQVIAMICVQRARDFDQEVRLVKGGVVTGTNQALPSSYAKTDAYQVYGGVGNTWGTTLTLADVTSGNFGVALSSRVQNREINIDHIQLRLHLESTLPVELVSFDGERVNKMIRLTWTTASELNNDYFELLRSDDAVSYTPVERVSGAGNSNTLIDYMYDDTDAPGAITNYYKLRQVDFDGNDKWYGPVAVQPDQQQTSPLLYPNPAVSQITVSDLTLSDNFVIYNSYGIMVKSGKMSNNTIDIDDLAPGIYYLSVAGSTEKIRFMKL